jgi:subtilisin
MATPRLMTPPGQPAPRPNSIIVFDHADGLNAHRVARVLDVNESALAPRRRGRAVLEARRAGQAESVIYESLGVAVAHLNDREIERLQEAQGIRLVLANEERRLPSPVAGRAADGTEVRSTTWALTAMGIEPGYSPTGNGVRVAVLDTGLDVDHPDFVRAKWGANNAKNFVDDTGVLNIRDRNGHGTHCSGLIAGPITPRIGPRYGVAPGVDIIVGRVLDASGSGSDDRIIDAIDWAAHEAGARVVSLSLGTPRDVGAPHSPLYETLAFNLLHHDERGTLIIAAAGNDSLAGLPAPLRDPAACPSVVSVGAVDSSLEVAHFSCQGIGGCDLQLVAPGVDMLSAWKNSTYNTMSGTSTAAPCVTGIAALILETEPRLTAVELRSRLLTLARSIGGHDAYGHGLAQWSSRQSG